MPRPRLSLAFLFLVTSLASPVVAAPTAAQRCQADVELASAKYSQCRLRAEAAFATTQDSTRRDVALGRCEGRLSLAVARSVAKYGAVNCTAATATEFDAYLSQCTDQVVAASLPGGTLPSCGNGVIDVPGEQCDGADVGGDSCLRLGFAGGALSCDAECRLTTVGCVLPTPRPTAMPTSSPTPVPTETPIPTPFVVADSVAEFSAVQGQGGWSYGYYATPPSAATFQRITAFDPTPEGASSEGKWWVNQPISWAAIWRNGQHPGAETSSCGKQVTADWTVRRWTSDVAGQIRLAGHIGKQLDGFDGAIARIIVDGFEIYTRNVSGSDLTGVDYQVFANVSVGSSVDFVVSPQGSDCNDWIGFTAVIEYQP